MDLIVPDFFNFKRIFTAFFAVFWTDVFGQRTSSKFSGFLLLATGHLSGIPLATVVTERGIIPGRISRINRRIHGNVMNGTIRSQEVKVEASLWPDYVFSEDYDLHSLEEMEAYIKANKHLPGIPSAEEVSEEGIALGEMNARLLQKVEELTLYIIDQSKHIVELEAKLKDEAQTGEKVEELMLYQIELIKLIKNMQGEIDKLKSKHD